MLANVDWAQAWKDAQVARRRADDSAFWDKRAPGFAKTAGTSPYARTFLQRAGVREGETVFDMGCGSGTLALPLARDGHDVYACDFSPVMVDLMMRRAEIEGTAQRIHTRMLAWDDDWSSIDVPVCDVAFASRSIATDDLAAALEKLDAMARRRVCITLATAESPRCDEVLMRAMGHEPATPPDFVYAMNILWGLGIQADLSYIRSERPNDFESFDAAIERTCEAFDASDGERQRLVEYSREHLHPAVDDEGNEIWRYDHQRVTTWAFVSWDKQERR